MVSLAFSLPSDLRNDNTNPTLKVYFGGPSNLAALGLTTQDNFNRAKRESRSLTEYYSNQVFLRKNGTYTMVINVLEDMACKDLKVYFKSQYIKVEKLTLNLNPIPISEHLAIENRPLYVQERISPTPSGNASDNATITRYRTVQRGTEPIDVLHFSYTENTAKKQMLVSVTFTTDIGNIPSLTTFFEIADSNFSSIQEKKGSSIKYDNIVISEQGN